MSFEVLNAYTTTTTTRCSFGLSNPFNSYYYTRLLITNSPLSYEGASSYNGTSYGSSSAYNDMYQVYVDATGLPAGRDTRLYGIAQAKNGLYYSSGNGYVNTYPFPTNGLTTGGPFNNDPSQGTPYFAWFLGEGGSYSKVDRVGWGGITTVNPNNTSTGYTSLYINGAAYGTTYGLNTESVGFNGKESGWGGTMYYYTCLAPITINAVNWFNNQGNSSLCDARVDFTKVNNATTYYLDVYENGTKVASLSQNNTLSSFYVSGLHRNVSVGFFIHASGSPYPDSVWTSVTRTSPGTKLPTPVFIWESSTSSKVQAQINTIPEAGAGYRWGITTTGNYVIETRNSYATAQEFSSGLSSDTEYIVTCKALSYGSYTESDVGTVYWTTAPSPPSFNTSQTIKEATAITLFWSQPAAYAGGGKGLPYDYVLQWDLASSSSWSYQSVITSTSYRVSNLLMNTQYKFKIQARWTPTYNMLTDWSGEVLATTLNLPPVSVPTFNSINVSNINQILITINNVSNAIGYNFKIANSSMIDIGGPYYIANSSSTGTTSYTFTGLTAGEIYNIAWQAVANSSYSNSPYSSYRNVKTKLSSPNFTSKTISTSSITINCSSVYGANNYVFILGTNTQNASNASTTFNGLVSGTIYNVQFYAEDSSNPTVRSNTNSVNIKTQLNIPVVISSNTTSTSISVSFSQPNGALSVRARIYNDNGSETGPGSYITEMSQSYSSGYTITFTGLVANRRYWIDQCAEDSNDSSVTSAWSNATSYKTVDLPPLPIPSIISFTSQYKSITFSTTFPTGADGIMWEIYDTSYILLNYGSSYGNSFVISGLNTGRTYYVRIKAFDNESGRTYKDSNWSNYYTSYTKNEPYPPSFLTNQTEKHSSYVVLYWTSVNDVASPYYEVRYRPKGLSWIEGNYYSSTCGTISGLNVGTVYEAEIRAYIGLDYQLWTQWNDRVEFTARVDFFEWDTLKVSGQICNVKANEWNRLRQNINGVRTGKNITPTSFGTVTVGRNLTAELYNLVRNTIVNMNPSTTAPPNVNANDKILASLLNGLRDSLNSL